MRLTPSDVAAARRVRHDERGAVLLTVALCVVALAAMAALAVDLGAARQQSQQAQAGADAAALAGAQDLPSSSPDSAASATAAETAAAYAASNVLGISTTPTATACDGTVPPNAQCFSANRATIVVATPYASSRSPIPSHNLVYVRICEPSNTYFASAIDMTAPTVCREAVARRLNVSGGFGMGLVTLHPSKCQALTFAGNSTTQLSSNGAVMVNSNCTDSSKGALDSSGASWNLYAGYIGVVGSATLAPCSPPATCAHTVPTTGINPFADPYNLSPPASAGLPTRNCAPAKQPNNWRVLEPGYYGSSCTFGNSGGTDGFILRPGLYWFANGFNANGNVPVLCANSGLPTTYAQAQTIGCSGVTLFSNNGDVTLNGGAGLYLPPPTTGPYAGVTLYDNRTTTGNQSQTINGGNQFTAGSVYAPKAKYRMLGNATINVTGAVVVNEAEISGNGYINITVPENVNLIQSPDDLGLVE